MGGKSSFPTLQVATVHSGGVWGRAASGGTDADVVRPPFVTVSREFVQTSSRAKIGAKLPPTEMSTGTTYTTDGIVFVVGRSGFCVLR